MQVHIPFDPNNLGGKCAIVDTGFQVLADNGKTVIVEFFDTPVEVTWIRDFEMLYCQRQHNTDVVKAIHKATDEECRTLRVPLWIQGEEVPECCGRPMYFVGQIDDNVICTQAPKDAEMWWHDVASFYVFTCAKCLSVKAVGQQF